MGKKSKRKNRGSGANSTGGSNTTSTNNANQDAQNRRVAPNLRKKEAEEEEEETLDNLRFEDPYVEEVDYDDDEEEIIDHNGDEEEDAADDDDAMMDDDEDLDNQVNKNQDEIIHSWHPLMGTGTSELGSKEQPMVLEMDPTAYKMMHSLRPEWPCLSFDFLKDNLGMNRTRFPHSLRVCVGTQADKPENNSLQILQLSDLARLRSDNDEDDEDEILGEEYSPTKKKDGEDSEESDSDDEEDFDLDPILEHYNIPHYGGVNRVRVMPQQSDIVATWADTGDVHLFNIRHILERFHNHNAGGGGNSNFSKFNSPTSNKMMDDKDRKPFYTHSGHATEGFAMDWSTVQQGSLASGDCYGNIHFWKPSTNESYEIVQAYNVDDYNKEVSKKAKAKNPLEASVEDIQWSPTESTVFASAECGGRIRIFDIRAPHRAMLTQQIHPASKADVNVIGWNHLVANLLASGGDDGTLQVWDLRHFNNSDTKVTPKPLARFGVHQTPITSVEWHPTDESMLAVSDAVGAYIYDLSVEEDDATAQDEQRMSNSADGGNGNGVVIPPQMLFTHAGSQDFKEIHWHPQISSCIMTTAYSGFSIFIPSNL